MCSVMLAGIALSTAATAVSSQQGSVEVTSSGSANTASTDVYASQQRADHARAQGDHDVEQARRQYSQTEGRTMSTLAAGNVSLASGSAIDLLVNDRSTAQQQMNDIKYQSEMKAWEYEVDKSKAEARMLPSNQSVTQDSWGDTLTNPVFIINTAQKTLPLFRG